MQKTEKPSINEFIEKCMELEEVDLAVLASQMQALVTRQAIVKAQQTATSAT